MLLAVAGLVAVVLVAPVRRSRMTVHRVQCLGNQKHLSSAVRSYTEANGGRLPRFAGNVFDAKLGDPDSPAAAVGNVLWTVSDAAASEDAAYAPGWPTALLPHLDQGALTTALQAARPGGVGDPPAPKSELTALLQTTIPGFTCPDDEAKSPNGLSYVGNVGLVSAPVWNRGPAPKFPVSSPGPHGGADAGVDEFDLLSTAWRGAKTEEDRVRVSLAAGVFVRPAIVRDGDALRLVDDRQTLDRIARGDGTTQTLMFSERRDAGPWWGGTVAALGFGWPVPTASTRPPFVPNPRSDAGGFGDDDAEAALAFDGLSTPRDGALPGSVHPGSWVVMFCDGHGATLSNLIDRSVYVRLLTPAGVAYGQDELDDADVF